MVANFAMQILNGVGGAKLEKIIPIDTQINGRNPSTYSLSETYKYVILEVCYAGISSSVSYLKIGSQLFFLNNDASVSKYIIVVDTSNPDTINNTGIEIVAYVTTDNIVTLKHGYGDYHNVTFKGNIYCFN